MRYEKLSLSSFIKEIKEVTIGAHPRKFCFILGAGASRNSGIKSGQDLVRIWDGELRERNEEEYNNWRSKLGINDENRFGFYSQYYEKRFHRCPSDGLNYIEKIMESAKPSAGYVMLAHMLTQTPHNVVVTTNFDHLTEDAVTYYAQRTPLVVGHESLSHYVSAHPVRPTIIKIHRDLLFDPKSTQKDLEKLPDNWKNALGLIFENYHPIFIGYAGNDKSLMDFLIENSDKFANNEWKFPYWTLFSADKIEGKVKEFLEASQGFYIEHNGFDDVMLRIGAAFDYKMPEMQVFLQDAQNRYDELSDAIASLSDDKKRNQLEPFAEKNAENVRSEQTSEEEIDRTQAMGKITESSEQLRQYLEASQLMDEKKYEEALPILESLVATAPNNARYRYHLGNVLHNLDRQDEAMLQYDLSIAIDPKSSEGYYWKGTALYDSGDYAQAVDVLKIATENAPEDTANRALYALALKQADNDLEAITQLRKVIESNPEVAIYHFVLGSILEDQKMYEDARVEYQVATTLEPDDKTFFLALKNSEDKISAPV